MRIDKQAAKEITNKIKGFINTLEAQYGVVVERSGGTFSDAELKIRFTLKVLEPHRDAGVLTPAEAQYDRMRQTHDLPPRGTVVTDAYGENWIPVEWIPKGRKYTILATKISDGRRYKFSDASISRMNRE